MAAPLQIGKYELVRKLASGGMAEVYLARAAGPAGFQKTLVVKRILPHLAEDPKFVEMFLVEARLAAALNHPGVVQIFDFGEADEAYYLAMEYVDGPDLGSLWRAARGRLPIAHAVKIISLACEALDYAHEFRDPESGEPLNIVHRDVSPDNILLARTGAVKVTDFGVAKAATTTQKTQAGTLKGKFAYMAPEQLRGKPLDRRADVYSTAATLYEALAGNRLFDVEGDVGLLNAVAREPHVGIRERRPEVPEALARLLDQALAKDPGQRPPSCRAFGVELENFLRSTGQVVGSYELSSLVAQLADRVAGPWNEGAAAGRSGMRPGPAPARESAPSGQKAATAAAAPSSQPLRAHPSRRAPPETPPPPPLRAVHRAPASSSRSELPERLQDLARLDAVREWLAAMKDPAQRRQAIDAARAFPRTHPLEMLLGAGSVVLIGVTLWLLLSALFIRG